TPWASSSSSGTRTLPACASEARLASMSISRIVAPSVNHVVPVALAVLVGPVACNAAVKNIALDQRSQYAVSSRRVSKVAEARSHTAVSTNPPTPARAGANVGGAGEG